MSSDKQGKASSYKNYSKGTSKESPRNLTKANGQARIELVFMNGYQNENSNKHQFVIQDPDQLNQRYNQFKVRFAEKLLPSRDLVERQMGKLLQQEFPQLYRFKLLLHITQVSQMLFIIETEMTYWFASLRAYFLHLDNTYENKIGNNNKTKLMQGIKGVVTKDSFLNEWADQDFLDTLILAGMFVKKRLLHQQLEAYDTNRQYDHNNGQFFNPPEQTDDQQQNSIRIQEKNHQVIVEDSQNEIESIEQNILTFKHTEDYHIKYKYFEQLMMGPHINFGIEDITLKQITALFNLLNGRINTITQADIYPSEKKIKEILGKRSNEGSNEDDLNQQAKRQKLQTMAEYIEWIPKMTDNKEGSHSAEENPAPYVAPNCHEVDYNWEVDAILKSAQQYNKDDKK